MPPSKGVRNVNKHRWCILFAIWFWGEIKLYSRKHLAPINSVTFSNGTWKVRGSIFGKPYSKCFPTIMCFCIYNACELRRWILSFRDVYETSSWSPLAIQLLYWYMCNRSKILCIFYVFVSQTQFECMQSVSKLGKHYSLWRRLIIKASGLLFNKLLTEESEKYLVHNKYSARFYVSRDVKYVFCSFLFIIFVSYFSTIFIGQRLSVTVLILS